LQSWKRYETSIEEEPKSKEPSIFINWIHTFSVNLIIQILNNLAKRIYLSGESDSLFHQMIALTSLLNELVMQSRKTAIHDSKECKPH
jgi:hypothetical protein